MNQVQAIFTDASSPVFAALVQEILEPGESNQIRIKPTIENDPITTLNSISDSLESGRRASFEIDSDGIVYQSYLDLIEAIGKAPSNEHKHFVIALERLSCAIREHNADLSTPFTFNSVEDLINALHE
jgi:hypothetical protein